MKFRDNFGYCKEHEGEIPWSQCVQETILENSLNIDECKNDPDWQYACIDGVFNIDKCRVSRKFSLNLDITVNMLYLGLDSDCVDFSSFSAFTGKVEA